MLRRIASTVDRAALRAADVVVVDTEAHAATVAGVARRDPVVVPVGAPEAWFAGADADAASPSTPPSAVFFGLYTPLQGTRTLGAALASLEPGTLRVTMVGDGQDGSATQRPVRSSYWARGGTLSCIQTR